MKENDAETNAAVPKGRNLEEAAAAVTTPHEATVEDDGPQVPKPHERPADIDRKIRGAVDRMLEDVQNPYETVIMAAQEARRVNERRLKARSILNQTMEPIEELLPEVPFLPRPLDDDEPEVKPTNEALEKLALGLVQVEMDGQVRTPPSYYDGEIDFPLYPDPDPETAEGPAEGA